MATKVPLAERQLVNGKEAMVETSFKSDTDEKPKLKSTAHLSVKTDRENANKRSRDCPSQSKWQHVPQGAGMRGSKKSRGTVPNQNSKGTKKPSAASATLPPGRPKLTRRVGGIAPNGNPQCWYAPHESEMDPHRIAQRMKQVEFGKNSAGYQAYLTAVPRADRKGEDPQTPDVRTKCSKRCFDGLLRSWRRRLHRYDPPGGDGDAGTSGQQAGMDNELVDDKDENEDKEFPCTPIKRSHMSINVGDSSRGSDHATGANAETKPVPWEEIERMSLCSPLWGDDKDSDISEPDSQDRVTIYTTDLSPTASELACMHQAEAQSELWGTPRSHFSMPKDDQDEMAAEQVARSPPSPFSPWAPWGTAKASFADALRSPVAMLDLEMPTGSIPLSSKISAAQAPEAAAGAGTSSQQTQAPAPVTMDSAPVTFGDAFASGMLQNTVNQEPGSMFGKGFRTAGDCGVLPPGISATPVQQNFIADEELEPQGNSISMKAMTKSAWGDGPPAGSS